MKKWILLIMAIVYLMSDLWSQDTPVVEPLNDVNPQMNSHSILSKTAVLLDRFSFSASVGTPSLSGKELKSTSLKQFSRVSLSNLMVSYKHSNRLSYGVALMGSLGSCTAGYYNKEGMRVSFDDDHDELDDLAYPADLMDDASDLTEAEDDDCQDDASNLMGSVTFKLSDKYPFFLQAAGGYSFSESAPAYTAMVGYSQKIVAGFGLLLGVRFSDILHKKPSGAVNIMSPGGLKIEFGANWNF